MKQFDAPIPGQSLTMQRGSMAMERPAQFTDPNTALEYVFDRLTQPKKIVMLLAQLKDGCPVEYLTRAILFEGIIQGKWTPDVAMLMAQVIMWQIEAIAKLKGIKVTLKNPDPKYDEFMANYIDLLTKKEEPTATPEKAASFFFKGGK